MFKAHHDLRKQEAFVESCAIVEEALHDSFP